MSADKRTVHTDALATLGTLIGPNEKRDAIHLAVIPAIAGQSLAVGADVYIKDGKAWHFQWDKEPEEFIGIVDPFLKGEIIEPGSYFWLIIYPRKITSLRHVWEHPAFPNADAPPIPTPRQERSLLNAMNRIECVAVNAGLTYEELMAEIDDAIRYENNYISAKFSYEPDSGQLSAAFWADWSLVTGRSIPSKRPEYFSCSC